MSLEQEIQKLSVEVMNLRVEVMNLTTATNAVIGKNVALAASTVDAPTAAIAKPAKKEKADKPALNNGIAAPAVSRDQLFDKLKEHGQTFGLAKTKELMIKYGADKTTPSTHNIPVGNYPALYKEAVDQLTPGKVESTQEVFE